MASIQRTQLGPIRELPSQAWSVGESSRATLSFQELLQCFLQAGRNKNQRSLDAAVLLAAPMPLHLEHKLAKARQLGSTGLTGSQPVTVQTQQVATAKGQQIEIRSPEIHADGSVTYQVTRLSQAQPVEELNAHPELGQSIAIGQIPIMPVPPVPPVPESFWQHWFFDQNSDNPAPPAEQD